MVVIVQLQQLLHYDALQAIGSMTNTGSCNKSADYPPIGTVLLAIFSLYITPTRMYLIVGKFC
ncbi:MAG: hypothetical protein IPH74_00880 [Bacteroidetes bacterium]|nr:hypothetical protein [Bacteroidota bacterium]